MASEFRAACGRYAAAKGVPDEVDRLQAAIIALESEIVALEESDLRSELRAAEAEIELAKFTLPTADVQSVVRVAIRRIEAELTSHGYG